MPQEPQPKRKASADPAGSRPTQDRTSQPRGGDPFNTPSGSHPQQYRRPDQQPMGREPAASPELRRADAADTRQRAGAVRPTDQMRDLLGRMPADVGADEPDIAPRPEPELTDMPAVIRQDLATITSNIQAAGQQNPEWHTVDNLPGFMAKAIRATGRGTFGLFTRTRLEDIATVANVNGQGPNSREELNAVAGWLKANAEDMGESEIDYSRVMPGYTPRVREYRTADTRFHVVQDDFGQYIYAYPESDAVTHSNTSSITNKSADDNSEDERDEFGARIKRISKESKNMTQYTSGSEQIRSISNRLQELEEQAIRAQQLQELIESLLDESSLSRMIGDTPGGQSLVKYLHRINKLGNEAAWSQHPFSERVMWTEFKNAPDNFIILTGTQGVAGIKPNEDDIKRGYDRKGSSYNPARDNTLRYQVVAFLKDQQVDPALLRSPTAAPDERDADPSVMRARGGVPSRADARNPENIFDRIAEQIGTIQGIYISKGAVERGKMATRAGYKQEATVNIDQVAEKIKPVFQKLLNQTIGNIGPRIQKYATAGNYDSVEKLTKAGKELQKLLTALDTSTPDWESWSSPLRMFKKLVQRGITEIAPGDPAGQQEAMKNIAMGRAKEMGDVLNSIRANLYKIYEIY